MWSAWRWLFGQRPSSARDRPVMLHEGKNVWPENITFDNIRDALANRLPDPEDECEHLCALDYGASHVVAKLRTRKNNVYVVRITGTLHEDFEEIHPFLPKFKESSEVASMLALRSRTKIPVPRVFVADDDADGRVGGAWMLQEYMPGQTLAELWPQLSRDARIQALKQIADWKLQLLHLDFDMIGSLECTSILNGRCNMSNSELEFKIGPQTTRRGLPNEDVVGPPKNPGPWSNARS